jgi:CubicO group peptidase (beta-lactamase class C family)
VSPLMERFRYFGLACFVLAMLGGLLLALNAVRKPPVIRLSVDDAATRDRVQERLAYHKVPGVSIAVVQDGRIVLARGFGVVEAGGEKPLTDQTRFQAASISKPVTALAALRLVQQGKLELDDALNKRLISWKIPENEFTEKQSVTLRQILSHNAGLSVHGFRGYPAGAERPSLLQVLDGASPANSAAIRVTQLPGSKVRYSGGGFCVLQQALTDATGLPFAPLLQDLVLSPLKMDSSSFAQPLPKELESVAAVGHVEGKPVTGKWHTYPELAAAGLWTTPSDLARLVIGVQQARRGDRGALLSTDLARQMLTRQIDDRGLGFELEGEDKTLVFTHGGANEGFTCRMFGSFQGDRGSSVVPGTGLARIIQEGAAN